MSNKPHPASAIAVELCKLNAIKRDSEQLSAEDICHTASRIYRLSKCESDERLNMAFRRINETLYMLDLQVYFTRNTIALCDPTGSIEYVSIARVMV